MGWHWLPRHKRNDVGVTNYHDDVFTISVTDIWTLVGYYILHSWEYKSECLATSIQIFRGVNDFSWAGYIADYWTPIYDNIRTKCKLITCVIICMVKLTPVLQWMSHLCSYTDCVVSVAWSRTPFSFRVHTTSGANPSYKTRNIWLC